MKDNFQVFLERAHPAFLTAYQFLFNIQIIFFQSQAASVFVLYATSSANAAAQKSSRKTITGGDVISAMSDMEFEKVFFQRIYFKQGTPKVETQGSYIASFCQSAFLLFPTLYDRKQKSSLSNSKRINRVNFKYKKRFKGRQNFCTSLQNRYFKCLYQCCNED